MRTYRESSKFLHYLGLMLGQSSLVIGFLVALTYSAGFALIMAQRGPAPVFSLPPVPPILGLLCGALGIALARWERSRTIGAAVAGLALNALALALAAWLIARV